MSKFTLFVLLLSFQVASQSLGLQYEPVRPPWHQVAIESLSISGDGKTAASLAGDGDVAIWNVSDRQLRNRWSMGHAAESIALAPDGNLLAVNDGRSLWMHDTRTGDGEKLGESGSVLAFMSNGDLATGGADGSIRFWRSGSLVRTLPGSASVTALAPAPSGQELVVAYGAMDSVEVKRWDLRRGVTFGTLPPAPEGCPHAPVRGFSYSADGNYLAGHTEFGCLLWETKTSRLVRSVDVERGDSMAGRLVRSISFAPRELYLVSVQGVERLEVPSGKRLQVTPFEGGLQDNGGLQQRDRAYEAARIVRYQGCKVLGLLFAEENRQQRRGINHHQKIHPAHRIQGSQERDAGRGPAKRCIAGIFPAVYP